MEKDIKEYVIGSFSKGNTTMSDPNHEYMFFEVIPNADMVRKFKEEFIKVLSEPLMYKLICNKIDWIRSSKYITGDNFFEMGLIPLQKSDKGALSMFMNNTSAVININRYKALTVNGVKPKEATVKDGSYKIQRPFVLVTKVDTKLSEAAQKFFDYATSSEVSNIISESGAVPTK